MMIQPLVENAIRHGIERASDAGRIKIMARIQADLIIIAIEDDGPGFTPTQIRTQLFHGIGITNTRDRLLQLFDGSLGFIIENINPRGARIQFEFPYQNFNQV